MNLTARAATLYDEALDRGEPFTVAELVEQLTDELLASPGDLEQMAGAAADSVLRRVDKNRTAAPPQASLFDSLDQAVAVADGRRLARRDMRIGDWTNHLAHVSENAGRVNASAAKENTRFSLLAPYLGQGLTTEEAVKAWAETNPDGVLP